MFYVVSPEIVHYWGVVNTGVIPKPVVLPDVVTGMLHCNNVCMLPS